MKYALKEKVKIIGLIFAEISSVFKPHVPHCHTAHLLGVEIGVPCKVLPGIVTCSYFKCVCLSGGDVSEKRGCWEVENLSRMKCQSNSSP